MKKNKAKELILTFLNGQTMSYENLERARDSVLIHIDEIIFELGVLAVAKALIKDTNRVHYYTIVKIEVAHYNLSELWRERTQRE